jgi:GMP synthase-like glutamine amidotransferase
MATVLILQHDADIPPGHLGTALDEAGLAMEIAALDEGEPIPEGEWVGVVSLGGVMGPYEEAAYPWLRTEKDFLARVVAEGVPTLGICLGAQLLADALGGRAFRSETGPEIGMIEAALTPAGENDPVVAGLTGAVVAWHSDTFDLPPVATLLASSERFPHAFRCGSAVGIQSHPEADPAIVAGWMAHPTAPEQLEKAGVDRATLAAEVEEGAAGIAAIARSVFGAWAASLRA